MPVYKLKYFNVRGRAELIRWLFLLADLPFEDVRFEAGEEWKAIKNNLEDFPFKQMPVLEVVDDDGKRLVIAQTHAISRFVANAFGLAGKSSYDVGRCAMLDEHIKSALEQLPWAEKDPETKERLMKEAIRGPITDHLKLLENFVQDNGFLVGDDFTLADIHFVTACEFFTACDFFKPSFPDLLDVVPKLKALNEKVRSLPRIAAWIAKRPVSHI